MHYAIMWLCKLDHKCTYPCKGVSEECPLGKASGNLLKDALQLPVASYTAMHARLILDSDKLFFGWGKRLLPHVSSLFFIGLCLDRVYNYVPCEWVWEEFVASLRPNWVRGSILGGMYGCMAV